MVPLKLAKFIRIDMYLPVELFAESPLGPTDPELNLFRINLGTATGTAQYERVTFSMGWNHFVFDVDAPENVVGTPPDFTVDTVIAASTNWILPVGSQTIVNIICTSIYYRPEDLR